MDTILAMRFELALTLIIFVLLFLKIGGQISNGIVLVITNGLLLVTLGLCVVPVTQMQLFGDMFLISNLLNAEKAILLLATLVITLTNHSWLTKHAHLPEFFMLMLSSLLGLFFMLSSGNLLMFYLGLELSTIPLAALCNFNLDKKVSSEAAMKMILSSAFSSGILLFGISLLYGVTGSIGLFEIPAMLNGSPLQQMAFLIVFTGFAFKLSVVPFHLWTADVYEGSPVAVTAFLSVVSKGAMAFALATVLYYTFGPLAQTWYYVLICAAIVTIIIGNLFALRQNNLKRFFAFSSITQVGYLLIGIVGLVNATQFSVASVLYFILIYLFSNLAAFGVISVISAATGRETINDYKGLYKSNPMLAMVMTLALFSLAGIPPTAGFFGKLFLLTAGASAAIWTVITIAALNLVVSLYYYLRIVRAMFIDVNEVPLPKLEFPFSVNLTLLVCVAAILAIGFAGKLFDVLFNFSASL